MWTPARGEVSWRGRALVALAAVASVASACGSDPVATTLDPDVPRWAGGCFLGGAPGKIVNASPSPDLQPFGAGCEAPGAPGGVVYLDRFDPISGDGDVTVLSSAPGAAPVVVAPHGGGGSIQLGSTGARFDASDSRLLTLANITFVTGDLVEASLPDGKLLRTIGQQVRMGNYDYAADGGALYVGNYDAQKRVGDLFHAAVDGAPQLLASAASRFDFVMYRLAPDRARVAFLQGWTEAAGGDLVVQRLPPGSAAAAVIAHGVYRMAWTSDGHLVFRTVNDDQVTYALSSWDGSAAPRPLAAEVTSASILGNDVLFTTGWSVLEQRASLHLTPAAGGADFLAGVGPASLQVTLSRPEGTDGVIAFFAVPSSALPVDGDLTVTRLSRLVLRTVDTGVTISGGVGVSPGAGYVSYAVGFAAPQAPGSANPQPGIASSLRIAAVDAGAPFELASDASTFTAWDPQERFVGAVGDFEPAANRGNLVVRRLPDGASLLSIPEVGNARFGFADDGSLLWAIRSWDDAQQRGQLVIVPVSGAGAWQPVAVAGDATWVGPARGGRVLYGVRDGVKDGIWLGAAAR